MEGSSTWKLNPNLKVKEIDYRADENEIASSSTDKLGKKVQSDGSKKEVRPKMLQYFMERFCKILCQIMKHKSAIPFLKPVDAVALGQGDYYEVITKPMDLGTILKRMEAKEESSRYKNVNEICTDVRLVFTNATQYYVSSSDVHIKAQELSSEFEKMWYPLSLEVAHEEWRRSEDEEDEMEETAYEKFAQDAEEEALGRNHEEHWEEVAKSCCRKLSREEKLMLWDNIHKLSVEDLTKGVEIAAKYDPDFDVSSDEAEIDLDSMCVLAQWMLYSFVKKCNKRQGRV